MTAPASTRYSAVAIALHWLLALLIIGTFCVGFYMADLPFSPQRLKLFNWHKWAGVTVLALSALRLLWRVTHKPPPDLAGPLWQRLAAHGTHWALYALFFLVPLAGWAYSSAAGFPVVVFGIWPLPDFVPRDKALAEVLKDRHAQLAFTLAALVLLHVAAALKHQFIDRDGLINRMRLGAR
jgi:cytochrome b561